MMINACSKEKTEDTDYSEETEERPEYSEKTKEEDPNLTVTKNMLEESTDPLVDLLERAPEEPTNLEEVLNYPIGPLAGMESSKTMDRLEMLDFVKDTLPPIEDSFDHDYLDKWWLAYRYLFAGDYPDPKQILKSMSFDHFGNPGIEDNRFHFKDQINVLVILDVSGSMANTINGKSMMDIAKNSIREFTSDLPIEANIGLRVYGHEGKRTGKTKEQSCESTELVYDIQPLNKSEFQKIINSFEPTGWTPIGLSLEAAKEDFTDLPGDENTNLVYVVSDGAETCGGDPVRAAKELADSNIQPIINVIGFNVDIDGQSHLRDIADAGGGVYTNAGNEEQLKKALDKAEEIIKQWKKWKDGAEADAYKQKSSQTTDAIFANNDWNYNNFMETVSSRSILGELQKDGYIPHEARSYMLPKIDERNTLYAEIGKGSYTELLEEIESNYKELLKQINKEFEVNTGD